jgi:hypothetical protein
MMQADPTEPEPSFPQRIWVEPNGRRTIEYVIPEDRKAEVLEEHWLYVGKPPSLDATCYDLHADLKPFRVGDFKLIKESDNFFCIVSPLGGSLIDWLTEEDLADDDEIDDNADDDEIYADLFDYPQRDR